MTGPGTPALVDEAREILVAAGLVVRATGPADVRIIPAESGAKAVYIDVVNLEGRVGSDVTYAFPDTAFTAATATLRAAGWYVRPVTGLSFRTGPGEVPTCPTCGHRL